MTGGTQDFGKEQTGRGTGLCPHGLSGFIRYLSCPNLNFFICKLGKIIRI